MTAKQVQEFKETEIGKIPADWKITQLENVCTKITDGSHFSPKAIESGTKRIASVKDIENNDFNFNSCKIISDKAFDELEKNGCKPVDGDVIFSKDGTMGLTFVYKNIQDLVLLSSIAIIRAHKQMNPYFLNFYLRNEKIQKFLISGHSSGSALPRIVLKDLKKLSVIVPEIEEQKRIVKYLYNLDTKIKNLQSQNKILEQTAQAIFKSWFVDFDGQTEFEDSELGQIPKGWNVDTIFSHCEQVNYGYTQSSSTEPVGPKFLRITDIVKYVINWSDVPFCEIDPKHFEKYQLHDGDIVIARTGASTGDNKLITIPPKSVFASYLIRLRLKSRFMSEYVALFLQSITYKNYIHSILGEKSAQPNANAKTLTNCKITTPEKEILKKFAVISQLVHQYIEKNNHSISQLTKTRDALLPKLMSGEIRV